MTRFEVVFQGQVQPGAAPDQVRANVGKLFQVSSSQLESLFSGRRIVIKQGLDQVAADMGLARTDRAGQQQAVARRQPRAQLGGETGAGIGTGQRKGQRWPDHPATMALALARCKRVQRPAISRDSAG